MDSRYDVTKQQLAHPFTLPKFGEQIVCRNDGVTYTLGEPLDEGGFGQVFCCVDEWETPWLQISCGLLQQLRKWEFGRLRSS